MKKLKLILVVLITLAAQTSEAQLLRKIGKKAEEAAERTILNKTDEKTSKKVGEGIDDTVDGKKEKKKKKKKNKKSNNKTAGNYESSYAFSYKYILRFDMNSMKNETMTMNFFLEPDATYMGTEIDQQGMEMFQIMDSKNNVSHSFINTSGMKMVTSTDFSKYVDENAMENQMEDYTITSLPNKNILGYNCKGKQMENDEWTFIMYYTEDVNVSINGMFNSSASQQIPDKIKEHFDPEKDHLLMSLEMVDKKNKGKKNQSGKMECVAFEKEDFTFDTSGYTPY